MLLAALMLGILREAYSDSPPKDTQGAPKRHEPQHHGRVSSDERI